MRHTLRAAGWHTHLPQSFSVTGDDAHPETRRLAAYFSSRACVATRKKRIAIFNNMLNTFIVATPRRPTSRNIVT